MLEEPHGRLSNQRSVITSNRQQISKFPRLSVNSLANYQGILGRSYTRRSQSKVLPMRPLWDYHETNSLPFPTRSYLFPLFPTFSLDRDYLVNNTLSMGNINSPNSHPWKNIRNTASKSHAILFQNIGKFTSKTNISKFTSNLLSNSNIQNRVLPRKSGKNRKS